MSLPNPHEAPQSTRPPLIGPVVARETWSPAAAGEPDMRIPPLFVRTGDSPAGEAFPSSTGQAGREGGRPEWDDQVAAFEHGLDTQPDASGSPGESSDMSDSRAESEAEGLHEVDEGIDVWEGSDAVVVAAAAPEASVAEVAEDFDRGRWSVRDGADQDSGSEASTLEQRLEDAWGDDAGLAEGPTGGDLPSGYSAFDGSFAEAWGDDQEGHGEVPQPTFAAEHQDAPALDDVSSDDGWSWNSSAVVQDEAATTAPLAHDEEDRGASMWTPFSEETDVFGSDVVPVEAVAPGAAQETAAAEADQWDWSDEQEAEAFAPQEAAAPDNDVYGQSDVDEPAQAIHEEEAGHESSSEGSEVDEAADWTAEIFGDETSLLGESGEASEEPFEGATDLSPLALHRSDDELEQSAGSGSEGLDAIEVHDEEGWNEEWFSAAVAEADELTGVGSLPVEAVDGEEAAGSESERAERAESPDDNARDLADRLDRIAAALRSGGAAGPLTQSGGDPLAALIAGYLLGMNDARSTPDSGGH